MCWCVYGVSRYTYTGSYFGPKEKITTAAKERNQRIQRERFENNEEKWVVCFIFFLLLSFEKSFSNMKVKHGKQIILQSTYK